MLNVDIHKDFLIKILKDIYADNTLGPLLGFKGGTAALLFYELSRFSVDLDFDLLDASQEDLVFEKVGRIVSAYGKVKEERKKRFTLFWVVSYSDTGHNIKIEINRREHSSRYEVLNYFGITMQVMAKEDMFANKLAAFYERMNRANRDIYDVWFFFNNGWPLNKELLEKRTNLPAREFLASSIDRLEKIADTTILSGMGELLNAEQKAWARANLKKETLFFLRVKLDNEKKN